MSKETIRDELIAIIDEAIGNEKITLDECLSTALSSYFGSTIDDHEEIIEYLEDFIKKLKN